MIRSFLFVPGDSERKLDKALQAGADAIIVDLEDSVAADARPAARAIAADYLKDRRDAWVRINPVDTPDAAADLSAVVAAGPAGIVLPKPRSADDVKQLANLLDEAEKQSGMPVGDISILPIVTERPEALFALDGYADASDRLAGLSWGAEDLSAALGATRNRDEDGNWLPPYELARSLCLLGAAAAGVPAVDTVFTDFRDDDGLARYAAAARRDGFTGMLAIHPAQVDTINQAFLPTAEEVERAERIVALFNADRSAGTIGMDGVMIDRPHYVQALRILELAKRRQH